VKLVGNTMFVFGGNRYGLYINDFYKLDLYTLTWKKIKTSGDIPSARFGHCLSLYQNSFYMFGGYDIDAKYSNQLFKYHLGPQHLNFFKDYLNSKKYCDILVNVENQKFYCHKVILSQSPFLKNKIQNQNEIAIENFSLEVIKILIEFLYCGNVFVDNIDLTVDLICAASLFELEELETIALIYFKKYYNSQNLFVMLQKAHELKVKSLKDLCFAYFWKNPKGISVNLPEDLLLELLNAQNVKFQDYEVLKRKIPNPEERIANHIAKLYETKEFWDVKFKSNDKEYFLHRIILDVYSNFLNNDEVLKVLIHSNSLEMFLEFVYLRNLNSSDSIYHFMKIYKMLMKFPQDEIHGLICEKIIELLNPLNLLTVLQYVYENKITGKLKESCFEMVGENSNSILRSILEMQFHQNQIIEKQSKMLKDHENVIRLQQEAIEMMVGKLGKDDQVSNTNHQKEEIQHNGENIQTEAIQPIQMETKKEEKVEIVPKEEIKQVQEEKKENMDEE
jgi:uncharacterized coiled-coil protein SlyX